MYVLVKSGHLSNQDVLVIRTPHNSLRLENFVSLILFQLILCYDSEVVDTPEYVLVTTLQQCVLSEDRFSVKRGQSHTHTHIPRYLHVVHT